MSQTKAQLIDPVDGTIVNADINASAAIAGSKIDGSSFASITSSGSIVISQDNAIHFNTTNGNDFDAILRENSGNVLLINSRNDAILNIDSNNDSTDAHFAVAHGAATSSSTELFRVQENGNVGIGTTSPGRRLVVTGDTNTVISSIGATNGTSNIFLGDTDDEDIGALTYNHASNFLSFTTNASEAMRIDSSGRLLVGHSSSLNVGSGTGGLLQLSRTTGDVHQSLNLFKADNAGSILAFGKSRSATIGSYTVVQANDELGVIRFAGADGTDLESQAASIAAFVDATPGSNDMPGRLVFKTTTTGGATPSERVRIDSQGRVKIHGVGATISDHSGAVTQTPLYIQTVTNETAVNTSEGAASTGLFRMYDVSSSSNRYHGIELRNKSNGDIRILNQDRNTSDKGDLVIAMPKLVGGSSSGCAEKVRLSGLFDSVNIAGKGGAILLAPNDSGYNKQKVDVYISTVTGVTAVNSQAGDEVAGLIRFEDTGSSNNRFHGIELRNRNSGDIRILNKDVGASNKADMVFATDNGNDVTEVARFLNSGGLTFNGDTAAANALDDYEEGTWIPTVTYSNGGGATLTEQKGFYVKIGRQVHCQCAVSASSKGGGSGEMIINGLPFTSSGTLGTRHNGIMTYIAQFNSIVSPPILYNAGATTSVYVYHLNSSSSASALANVTRNNLNDTFAFRAHFIFYV